MHLKKAATGLAVFSAGIAAAGLLYGNRTVGQAVEALASMMEKKGFEAFCGPGIPGNLAMPRKQEIYETLNRCRGLLKII